MLNIVEVNGICTSALMPEVFRNLASKRSHWSAARALYARELVKISSRPNVKLQPCIAMPSSEYGNAVGGGLKLKGAKDAGVKKHNKKKKPKADSSEPKPTDEAEKEQRVEQTTLQKALADEEEKGDGIVAQQEAEVKEYGKTEAQRRHDERRKKRVCSSPLVCEAIGYGIDVLFPDSSTNVSNARA